MPFTSGGFDLVAQVDKAAIDVVIDVVIKQLERQGKTRFTHQIPTPLGAVTVDVELTGLSIPSIRSANPQDRFRSDILASFEVEAEITFTFMNPTRTERIGIRLNDLHASVARTGATAPVVSLEFKTIDVDVIGLGAIGTILNFLLDVAALGIRTVLSALGLKPIPVFPVADAFKQIGLSFASHDASPYLGTNQTETGLALAMDFEAANNVSSDIGAVQDVLTPQINTGLVINERLANQALGMTFATNDFGLVRHVDSGGIRFGVTQVSIHFERPRQRAGRIRLESKAAARVRRGKGGFFGRLFGRRRKVTIRVESGVDLETEIAPSPPALLPRLDFDIDKRGHATVATESVFASILQVLLGPLLVVFLMIFNEILNLSFSDLQRHVIDLRIENSRLVAKVTRFQTHINAGHAATLGLTGVGDATLSVDYAVGLRGYFELGHFTMDQLARSGVPMAVDYSADSIGSRDQELFLGVGLRSL